jgi:capsular polysaccharide biosynthesis protein
VTAATGSRGSGWATQGLSLFKALARRWTAILIVVVLAAAAGLLLSAREAASYSSSARVILSSSSPALSASSALDPTEVVRTQAQLADSNEAIDAVAKTLGTTHDYVAKRLTVVPSAQGYFFTITGKDSSKALAQRMVAAGETAYQALVANSGATQTLKQLDALKTQTSARILALQRLEVANPANVTYAAQVTQLTARLNALNAQENTVTVTNAASPTIVQLAEAPQPATQVAPKPMRNALVAALVGLFLSAAVIWILYLRRPTVQSAKTAADLLGVPMLAEIPGGRSAGAVPTEDLVASMGSVLAPAVKVVALTPGSPTDLSPDVVAGLAASWSDEQGVVLVLDAAHKTGVRGALERLPRASSSDLPRWANEPTCLARSSGHGRGHVLYSRVAPSRAGRPGGLAPILADRAPVVDLVLLLTPAFSELPVTAASAMQADVVIALTSTDTAAPVLAEVVGEWPGLAERIVGVVHDARSSYRRSARRASSGGGHGPVLEAPEPSRQLRDEPVNSSPVRDARATPASSMSGAEEVTDRFATARIAARTSQSSESYNDKS